MLNVAVHRAENSVPAIVSGGLGEPPCASHPFDILAVFALYQNVME